LQKSISLWSRAFEKGERNDHQHDAFSIAEWMRRSDVDGTLAKFFTPNLELAEKKGSGRRRLDTWGCMMSILSQG
jgi:hypothetical protein